MRKAGMGPVMRMQISRHKTDSMERRYNILAAEDVKDSTKLTDNWFKKQKAAATKKPAKAGKAKSQVTISGQS